MPFITLTNNHKCELPETRPDGTALVTGDTWLCDAPGSREVLLAGEVKKVCGLVWKWSFDQREGAYWARCARL